MHQIYIDAEEVIVWLGIESENSDKASRFIEYWAKKLRSAGFDRLDDFNETKDGITAAERLSPMVTPQALLNPEAAACGTSLSDAEN